ncbi:MAG: hypothetical protein QG556_872 [Pseudomonadota bacterium]|jgi:hypothetical protein|nr:hypothetical protein [Pseudomonadota bacterium]
MYWDVVCVKPVNYLELVVEFLDGLEGTIKINPSYLTGVFEPLKDKEYFNQVYVDHGVVTWPGDLDLAPDAMYKEIKNKGEWIIN